MKSEFVLATATAGVALLTAACGSSSSSASASSAAAAAGLIADPDRRCGEQWQFEDVHDLVRGRRATSTSVPPRHHGGRRGGGAPGSITIGSADFSENTILAYVYGDALAAKGVKVQYKVNIGERAGLHRGPQGRLDQLHPRVQRLDPGLPRHQGHGQVARPTWSRRCKTATPPSNLDRLRLRPGPGQPTPSPSPRPPRPSTSSRPSSSLVPVASKLTYGAPPNIQTRVDGIPGFKRFTG